MSLLGGVWRPVEMHFKEALCRRSGKHTLVERVKVGESNDSAKAVAQEPVAKEPSGGNRQTP